MGNGANQIRTNIIDKGGRVAIKVFVFDCGGVLLRRRDDAVYQVWSERLGLSIEAFAAALWEGSPWTEAEIGRISEDDYWGQVSAKLGIKDAQVTERLATELWADWALDEQVVEIIDGLRQRYQIAMLSNASDILEHKLEYQYGIADRFGSILNSARLGVAKPDPAVYKAMLAKLGAKADEVVFIDDRADNVAAAAALGIHVVWYVDASELQRQLACYLQAPEPAPSG